MSMPEVRRERMTPEQRLEHIALLCNQMVGVIALAGNTALDGTPAPRLTKKAVSRFVNLVYRTATDQWDEKASGPNDYEAGVSVPR